MIERTAARPGAFRRLPRRHEREVDHFAALTGIAAALIRTRRLPGQDAFTGDVP